jgi:hypothetical protein
VSGVAVLMLELNPHLTPNALKIVLEFTAIPLTNENGAAVDPLSQGAGAINASGAIRLALAIDATQPVGSKWLTAGMPFSTTIGNDVYAWSQTMIWGSHRVLGDGIVDENRTAWSTAIVWGDGTDDDNIVWGTYRSHDESDNIVWGTIFDEGDNIVWGTSFVWGDDVDDNIVWGTFFEDDNIVWGTNVVWGSGLLGMTDESDNIVWGTFNSAGESDNIVWGTLMARNIVWGTLYERNIVWGTFRSNDDGDNIVWGTTVMWGDRMIVGVRPSAGSFLGTRQ